MPRAKAQPKKHNAGHNANAEESQEEYDWNVKARLIDVLHDGRSSAHDASLTIEWPDEDPPDDNDSLSLTKVKKFKLNHGDVLRFDDYRFAQSFFVYRTPKEKYKLIENPDEGGSGHLTVPEEVLQHVTDALGKYKDILEGNCVILHLSHEDKFVKDQLGDNIPDSWDIAVEYNGGLRENVVITQGDSTWETGEWENATLQDIEKFFSGADEPNTKFVVKIDLKGDKFKEYKNLHSTKKKSIAWVKAFAKLPKTWCVEKGASGMGSTHYKTEWRCKGPTEEKDKAKKSIEAFFEGFEASIEEKAA